MVRTFAMSALVAVVCGLAVAWYMGRPAGYSECSTSQVAGASIGGPFELTDANGRNVTEQDVITEPSLLYFGYTFCPDVCPFDVSRNAAAIDILAEQGYSATPIFISIDPDRDTPQVVGDYINIMHDKMIGLTGTPEQVAAASAAYKTYYKAHKDGTDEYLVDHSTFTYLVFPEIGFVEFFRNTLTAEQMAEQTACFIANI